MRTTMQTGWITFLLLLAITSCQKDDANSARNINNSTTTAHATAGDEELLGFSPVGKWVVYYDWGNTGHYFHAIMQVNADGTWTSNQGFSGTWIDGRGIFMNNFNAPSRTTYSGTERLNKIVGIMSTFDVEYPNKGNFYMEHYTNQNFVQDLVPGIPNAAGTIIQK